MQGSVNRAAIGDLEEVLALRLIELSFEFDLLLNPVDASTMPVWVASQESGRGNFLAKLSAASVLATLPVVVAGWVAQKRMIRGLAMGAIK